MKSISVEALHFFTGAVLIVVGLLSWSNDGVSTMLSWSIFGAMYISMSDIGEGDMCCDTKSTKKHRVRVFAAYFGAILSVWMLVHTVMALG